MAKTIDNLEVLQIGNDHAFQVVDRAARDHLQFDDLDYITDGIRYHLNKVGTLENNNPDDFGSAKFAIDISQKLNSLAMEYEFVAGSLWNKGEEPAPAGYVWMTNGAGDGGFRKLPDSTLCYALKDGELAAGNYTSQTITFTKTKYVLDGLNYDGYLFVNKPASLFNFPENYSSKMIYVPNIVKGFDPGQTPSTPFHLKNTATVMESLDNYIIAKMTVVQDLSEVTFTISFQGKGDSLQHEAEKWYVYGVRGVNLP